MPRQTTSLVFTDRIAKLPNGGFMFRCQRKGHPETIVLEDRKKDIELTRALHDTEHHSGRDVAPRMTDVTVGAAMAVLVQRTSDLEALGKRDPKTTKFYNDVAKRVNAGLGEDRPLISVTQQVVRAYVIFRLRQSHEHKGARSTQGSRIVKELKAIELAASLVEVPLTWKAKSFVDEIRPAHRAKVLPDKEALVLWMKHLPESAKVFAFTKLRTVLRNEELYDLRVKNVDLKAGVIRYRKRAKRVTTDAVQVISDDLLPVLENLCRDKTPDAYVFTHHGRRVQQSTFRKCCIAASKAAKVTPVITSLGWIRHMVLTELRRMLGVDDTAGFAGHSTVVVTELFYDLDADKIESKKKGVEANVKAFPGVP